MTGLLQIVACYSSGLDRNPQESSKLGSLGEIAVLIASRRVWIKGLLRLERIVAEGQVHLIRSLGSGAAWGVLSGIWISRLLEMSTDTAVDGIDPTSRRVNLRPGETKVSLKIDTTSLLDAESHLSGPNRH